MHGLSIVSVVIDEAAEQMFPSLRGTAAPQGLYRAGWLASQHFGLGSHPVTGAFTTDGLSFRVIVGSGR